MLYWFRNADDQETEWLEMPGVMYRDRVFLLVKLLLRLVASLLLLACNKQTNLSLYINFMSGEVLPSMALLDTIRFIKIDIITLSFGSCVGVTEFLLVTGHKGKRYSLRNICLMLHHPNVFTRGQCSDVNIEVLETLRIRNSIDEFIAKQSRLSVEKVTYELRRKMIISTEDALAHVLFAYRSRFTKLNIIFFKNFQSRAMIMILYFFNLNS